MKMVPLGITVVFIQSGGSNSGKTTTLTRLATGLVEMGFKVGTVKDIHVENWSIDQEGKDTWHHSRAGASVVVARGPAETDFLFQARLDLPQIAEWLEGHGIEIALVEGCKEMAGDKLLVAKDEMELEDLLGAMTGDDEVLAIAGPVVGSGSSLLEGRHCLDSPEAFTDLATSIGKRASKKNVTRNHFQMPLAGARCNVKLDGKELPMKEYVEETFKNVVLGMIASLIWNVKEPVQKIHVLIEKNALDITVNSKKLKLKDFVQDSIRNVILAYLGSLRLDGAGTGGTIDITVSC